jgi:hypothetical protein
MPRIADALSPRQYEGTPVSEMATAAPPTYAQQAARIPGRIMDALRALGAGQTYGTADPTNSISDLARVRLGRGSVFGVPEDVQQRNVARATDIAMMAAPIVYHGTPHRFAPTAKNPLGEFDPTKIGSGEGAQAYGMGHYLSEAPSVAKSYQGSVSAIHRASNKATGGEPTIAGKPINWDDPQQVAAFELSRHAGDRVSAADFHARTFVGGDKNEAVKLLRSNAELPKVDLPGQLYKVDLPDEVVPRMLDWDKPLSPMGNLQIKPVAKNYNGTFGTGEYGGYAWHLGDAQLSRAFRTPEKAQQYAPLGREIIKELNAITKTPTGHSELLSAAGIPGIQYLDAGSRGAGTGTRNFVVFPGNESLLKILGRE